MIECKASQELHRFFAKRKIKSKIQNKNRSFHFSHDIICAHVLMNLLNDLGEK